MFFKKIISLFVLITATISYVNAQESRFKSFSLVIITPDTASIDPKFNLYIDSIQNAHLKQYYESIAQMERIVNSKDYPKDRAKEFEASIQRYKVNLIEAKKAEPEVKKFKYFQTISEYSDQVLNMYFNEYPPFSAIGLVKSQSIDVNSLAYLADSLKVDYIVRYHNIHSAKENGRDILKLTTILYSRVGHKILLEKETKGDTDSRGDMWSCSYPLSCLLVSSIKSSTDLIYAEIAKKQKK